MNAPLSAVHFATYEASKRGLMEVLPESSNDEQLVVHGTAGAAAWALAALVTTLVKTPLQYQICLDSTGEMTNLSDFPQDLLTEIASRLKKLEDYTSFACVSKSLRAAAKEDHFEGLRLRQHVPYLMLPVRAGNDDTRELYSLVDNESIVASVKYPNFKTKKCLESLGWLLMTEFDGSMSLLHPFSGTEIPLPHQNTFPGYNKCQVCNDYFFFTKMVLSSNPNETADFIVMVIGGRFGELAFWRLGDKAWNKIDDQFRSYRDVVYYGGGQFCAISNNSGVVYVFNFSGSDNQIERHIATGFLSSRLYILRTVDDSLIIITRASPVWGQDDFDITRKFGLHEVDIVTGKWKEIYSLGNMAVFLGHNSTIAVDASNFTGVAIKANHIYFTDDRSSQGSGRDSGVYNLET